MYRIALNSVAGVINACVCPSCSHLISKWAPPTERTKLTSYDLYIFLLYTFIELPMLDVPWECH